MRSEFTVHARLTAALTHTVDYDILNYPNGSIPVFNVPQALFSYRLFMRYARQNTRLVR